MKFSGHNNWRKSRVWPRLIETAALLCFFSRFLFGLSAQSLPRSVMQEVENTFMLIVGTVVITKTLEQSQSQ